MKYIMQCMVTVSAYTTVEANSEEEALAWANDRTIEISGNGNEEDEVWLVDEIDGSPINIRIDEVVP